MMKIHAAVALVGCLLASAPPLPAGETPPPATGPDLVPVLSADALIHLGSLDSFDITEGGTKAARLVLAFLDSRKVETAREAMAIYDKLIPDENYGGEYTMLQWLLACEMERGSKRKELYLSDPAVAYFYERISADNFLLLRQYLTNKYHLGEVPGVTPEQVSKDFYRSLEDLILFVNPRRQSVERSERIMEIIGLKSGDSIADVGSGPGYYTFKFSGSVGDAGTVYALERNPAHVDYLGKVAAFGGYKNVRPILTKPGQLGIPRPVDHIFISLAYHAIYTTSTGEDLNDFFAELRSMLTPDGSLVLVDNGLRASPDAPYHGPHIAKPLVVASLHHHGFDLVKDEQVVEQRYVLVFRKRSGFVGASPALPPALPPGGAIARSLAELPPTPGVVSLEKGRPDLLRVLSGTPLCVWPITATTVGKAAPSPGITPGGRAAAKLFLAGLRSKDTEMLRAASEAYARLMPTERCGDEYGALQWFCDHLIAGGSGGAASLRDPYVREYFETLSADDYHDLKAYVKERYFLEERAPVIDAIPGIERAVPGRPLPLPADPVPGEFSQSELNGMGDFIVFGNPYRERWERTDQVLAFLGVKPGDRIADVGCGSGYYSFRFARGVGEKGKIYALDMMEENLEFVRRVAGKHGFDNVTALASKENDCCLEENSIDMAYLCSLYHGSYVTSMEYVRNEFIASLKRALRPGGRLVIVDNQPLASAANPYYGPRIAKELIVAQLHHYGFKFAGYAQFVPQRYVLVFEKP